MMEQRVHYTDYPYVSTGGYTCPYCSGYIGWEEEHQCIELIKYDSNVTIKRRCCNYWWPDNYSFCPQCGSILK